MIRLHEKAPSAADARKRGLALFIGSDAGEKMYLLYDAGKLLDFVSDPKNDMLVKRGNVEADLARNCALGVVTTEGKSKGQWGASEVASSAAQEGYGPLTYDIVMELENGLIADRGSVSKAAKGVWDFYLKNRSDVEAKELDDIDDPKTKTKKDDAPVFSGGDKNPLNYAYFIKKGPSIVTLRNNHAACTVQLKKLRVPGGIDFFYIGLSLFAQKYK